MFKITETDMYRTMFYLLGFSLSIFELTYIGCVNTGVLINAFDEFENIMSLWKEVRFVGRLFYFLTSYLYCTVYKLNGSISYFYILLFLNNNRNII